MDTECQKCQNWSSCKDNNSKQSDCRELNYLFLFPKENLDSQVGKAQAEWDEGIQDYYHVESMFRKNYKNKMAAMWYKLQYLKAMREVRKWENDCQINNCRTLEELKRENEVLKETIHDFPGKDIVLPETMIEEIKKVAQETIDNNPNLLLKQEGNFILGQIYELVRDHKLSICMYVCDSVLLPQDIETNNYSITTTDAILAKDLLLKLRELEERYK